MSKTEETCDQVTNDIEESITGMGAVASQTSQLNAARNSIVDTVQSLTAIAQENAASTEETSASMMEIGTVVQDINKNSEELRRIAEILEDNMKQFKLD